MLDYERAELKEKFEYFLKDNNKNNSNFKRTKYDNFEAHYPDCILLEATIGGASGGNCWGGNASRYNKEDYEIVSELKNELKSRLMGILDEIKDLGIHNNEEMYSSYTEKVLEKQYNSEVFSYSYSEYYGNYTEYGVFAINIPELLSPILNEEQKEIFEETLNQFTNGAHEKKEKEKQERERAEIISRLKGEYETVNKKISTHEQDREDYKSQLEAKVKQAQQLLDNFTKDTEKLKENLISQQKVTENKLKELGVNVSSSNKLKK